MAVKESTGDGGGGLQGPRSSQGRPMSPSSATRMASTTLASLSTVSAMARSNPSLRRTREVLARDQSSGLETQLSPSSEDVFRPRMVIASNFKIVVRCKKDRHRRFDSEGPGNTLSEKLFLTEKCEMKNFSKRQPQTTSYPFKLSITSVTIP